jgi:hypothetical protein
MLPSVHHRTRYSAPMAEGGLEASEVGKEIAEHAKHAGLHGEPTSRRDRVIGIVEAGLLAIVALLAAWSGYASARWATESRLTVAEGSTARNQSSTAQLTALDARIGDALVFNAWFGAHAAGDQQAMQLAQKRFRPAFEVAFEAWLATDPDNNPSAPPGPQAMPEYKQPELVKSQKLDAKAERLYQRGSDQGSDADEYVRTTVYLASVLFLIGISSHFPVRVARFGLITIGVSILTFAVIQLLSFPKPA